MPLPTCECITGKPIQQQLGAIYCALLEILAGQGGPIDPNNIEGITPLGLAFLTMPEPADDGLVSISGLTNVVVIPNGDPISQTVTAAQISDASPFGQGLLQLAPAADAVILTDGLGNADSLAGFTGNGLTTVDTDRGVTIAGT